MLSRHAQISTAICAAFAIGAVSSLSAFYWDDTPPKSDNIVPKSDNIAVKSNNVAACVKRKTGLNDQALIDNNGISVEYFYEDKTYYEYYVFTAGPRLSTYVETGVRLTERQGKSDVVLHYDRKHWYDSGRIEPQRSIISAIKHCAAKELPERAPNLI